MAPPAQVENTLTPFQHQGKGAFRVEDVNKATSINWSNRRIAIFPP